MIPFEFEYYRPETAAEAFQTFGSLDVQGKTPLYFGGGTEIITMARTGNLRMGSVVDIKAVPECNVLELSGDDLVIGAAVTLTRIAESHVFPLLGKTVMRIADHTAQGKITIGGNLAGSIIYREAVLPLLLADARVAVEGANPRVVPLHEVFGERLRLHRGEFISRILVPERFTTCPHYHDKITRIDRIDYPLVTLAALREDGHIRVGLSGYYPFPFRWNDAEEKLSRHSEPAESRAERAVARMKVAPLDDIRGSWEYRRFMLQNTLCEALRQLGGAG